MHYYNKLKTKKSICTGNKQKIYIHQASQQNRIKQEMKEVDCHEKKKSQKFVQSVTCFFM